MDRLKTARSPGSPKRRQQLLAYVVVGGANTLFAYGVYALGLVLGLPYELASLAALVVGIAVSFVTQGRLVFYSQLKGRFLLFAATWAVLYLINITVIRALHWAGLDLYLAGLAAAIPVTAIGFLVQRGIVFANPPLPALRVMLTGLLLLLGAMRLDLALRFEANWDEFLNLAMVHSYARGELKEVLQTAFVHLFTWVPAAGSNEVDQVIAARLLVLLAAIITSVAIYGVSRRFMSVTAALFSVAAFNAFSFVMRHGNALRTDPLACALMMVAIWLAVSRKLTPARAVALGLLVGLAGGMTIKSIFYVPTIATILSLQVWYGSDRRRDIGFVALSGLTALAGFGAIVAMHGSTFPSTASASAFVARTSGATILNGKYAIIFESLNLALLGNLVFWVLLAIGIAGAIRKLRNSQERRDGVALLSLLFVLGSVLIYSEIYPYYYPFMLAPASVLVGLGFARVSGVRRGIYGAVVIGLLLASSALTYMRSRQQDNSEQHRTLALVHQLFPQPVAYIDHTAMVSSYPKQGFFMSRWGMSDYRRARTPIMAEIIARQEPRFMLATQNKLDVDSVDPDVSEQRQYGLLADDVRALRANYARYWGPLYLPGFRFHGELVRDVHIPGRYRLESAKSAEIDGRAVMPGAVVDLTKGRHRFFSEYPAGLRWAVPPPPSRQPPLQLFRGF